MTAPVTVIVPVYGGREATRRCLDSVVRHAASSVTPFELLVIDDCTPDPLLRQDLELFARGAHPMPVTARRNATNEGFVGSVNRGMESTSGDVVLLNSDTVVTTGWLDALTRTAASSPDVATVTPLTNEGSICSLPPRVIEHFRLDGPEPQIDACGRFVAENGLGLAPPVITGVGFCLLITREALDVCGMFDQDTFGRGYGEEVDFCLRATRMGFVHLVDDATFVFHEGGVSFASASVTAPVRASAVIRERYRFFAPSNRRERREDPLAVSFAALDIALDPARSERTRVLHLLHVPSTPAGGTERHVEALTQALADDVDSSILLPVESGFLLRSIALDALGQRVERDHLLPGAPARVSKIDDEVAGWALRAALDLFDFDAIHIHNLIGHSLAPLRVGGDFEGPIICTLHDFYLACPSHSLLYQDTRACGVPEDLDVCARCLPQTDVHREVDFLVDFRRNVGEHLDLIDRFVVADLTTADYLRRVYELPEDRVQLIEHGSLIEVPEVRTVDVASILHDPLRLAFVGRAWPKKGLSIVNRLASELAATDIEFHHFGPARDPLHPTIKAYGTYRNTDLPSLLRDAGIHIVLQPGPAAESYSYVMSEALSAGLPVIGAGYGALGHRIRTDGVGWTVDPTDPPAIRELVENLDRCRPEVIRASTRACEAFIPQAADLAERYLALYQAPSSRNVQGAKMAMTNDDRMRRHLRALAAVNWQLHAQLGERPPTRGRRLAARSRQALERVSPAALRCMEIGFEAAATTRGLLDSARVAARRQGRG